MASTYFTRTQGTATNRKKDYVYLGQKYGI